jgi:hypothetical protein
VGTCSLKAKPLFRKGGRLFCFELTHCAGNRPHLTPQDTCSSYYWSMKNRINYKKLAASGALIFFVFGMSFAIFNAKESEQRIVASNQKFRDDCVKQCAPKAGLVIEIQQFPTRPATLRGNHIVARSCECR